MSAVEDLIRARKSEGSGVFVGYLPIGFPDLQTSIDAAVAMVENGVDILELGLPYSDPVMDGVVIQKATQTALANGFTLRHGFEALAAISERVSAPAFVMTYWNPVVQFGVEKFAVELKGVGGAGLITPDLIPDEAADWIDISDRFELDRVFLAAPSSTDARLRQAVDNSRGFTYAVSTMGITGARDAVDAAARTLVGRLRTAGSTTACVGVGITTADHVREVLEYADGAIVGTAFVHALAEEGVAGVARTASALAAGLQR